MARDDQHEGLMPSLLDRLIDPDASGTSWQRGYSLSTMVDAVRRDLENLLNTRQSHQGLPESYVEIRNSLITYGLPDFSSINAGEQNDRRKMSELIEEIIARFEPRLRDIRAIPVVTKEKDEQHVRFHIDAKLRVDPYPEVGFETVVELMSGHTSVTPRES